MHEISRPADFTFPGAYFKRGTAEVHVVVETTPGRTAELRTPWSADELRTGYCVHFALEVPSLDTYRDILAAGGVTPVGGPRIRADNVEQIYLADPDGHILELCCRLDQPVADQRRAELSASGEGVPVAPGSADPQIYEPGITPQTEDPTQKQRKVLPQCGYITAPSGD
jgi:glyoxylase I family protein